jgi:8-oxo-dGTP diphosphatase
MKRFGEPRRKDVEYRSRPGAYGIVAVGRELLLTCQSLERDEIQLPGGGIDPGESPLRALHREVYEETGYHISPLRRLGAYQRFTYMPEYDFWAHKVCHIYLCRPALKIGEPLEENHSAVWMDVQDAVAVLENAGDAAFVSEAFSGLHFGSLARTRAEFSR